MFITLKVTERSLLAGVLSNPLVKHPNLQLGHEAAEFKKACFLSPEDVEAVEYTIKDTEKGKREYVNPEKAEQLLKEIPISVELCKVIIDAFKTIFSEGYTTEEADIIYPIVNAITELYETTVVEAEDLTKQK